MSVLQTAFTYTYPGRQATEEFYAPAVMSPDTTSLFRVISGVKYKDLINTIGIMGKVLQGYQGCGEPVDTGGPVTISNRVLETTRLEMVLRQCATDFEATIKGEATRSGVNLYDLRGTQLETIIRRVVVDALQRDIFRVFSFADTTSPAGDPSYYGMLDGLWSRLFAGTTSYEVTKVNGAISALNQTAGTRAIDYFQAIWEGADILLKQMPENQKKFFVTGNVFQNYLLNLQGVQQSGGGFTITTENGQTRAFYQGIEIVHFWAWDNWIRTDNLGSNVRILYTAPDNHIIGIEDAANQTEVNMWYDMKERKNVIEAAMRVGYNYIHSGLQAISYGNV